MVVALQHRLPGKNHRRRTRTDTSQNSIDLSDEQERQAARTCEVTHIQDMQAILAADLMVYLLHSGLPLNNSLNVKL